MLIFTDSCGKIEQKGLERGGYVLCVQIHR